jgi:ABC-type multidrug transport system ATPase subunit
VEIETINLVKTFRGGVRALDGVNLRITSGMFGVLGVRGAGKTTLLRVLSGIMRPSAGRVLVDGHDITSETTRVGARWTLGYVPEQLSGYAKMSVREFLDYIALHKGIVHPSERRNQVAELLNLVLLVHVADQRLGELSAGTQRRVAVAQALLGDPSLIFVDEPARDLDPDDRAALRKLLERLSADRTVVVATDDIEDIAEARANVGVLDHGRVTFTGPLADLADVARDRVWTVSTAGSAPRVGAIVSAVDAGQAVCYRIVSQERPIGGAPAEPTAHDGYTALISLHDHELAMSPSA